MDERVMREWLIQINVPCDLCELIQAKRDVKRTMHRNTVSTERRCSSEISEDLTGDEKIP